MRVLKLILIGLLLCSPLYAQGIDANTKLMLHFDCPTDGAMEVCDDGNTGHVGTLVATADIQSTTKQFGNGAFTFDGNSDYITFPDSSDWDLFGSTGDYKSIDFFFKCNTASTQEEIFAQGNANYVRYTIWRGADGKFGLAYASNGSSWNMTLGGATAYNDTDWHHFALIIDNGKAGIYIDGQQDSYGTFTAGTMAYPLWIGNRQYSPAPADIYMDEIRVYHGDAFGATPVVGLTDTITVPTSEYTSDANTKLLLHAEPYDVSGDGGSGTYKNSTFVATAQVDSGVTKFDNTLLLDGNSDYLTFPDSADWDLISSAADSWTVDFWIKLSDTAGNSCAIGQHEDGSNFWIVQHDKTNGGWIFGAYQGAGYIILTSNYNGEISDSNWHHVVLAKVADEYGIYMDSAQVNYVQDASTDNYAGPLVIGAYGVGVANYVTGNMDEVRIQKSNYFSAAPNSTGTTGNDDFGDVPTVAYSVEEASGRRIILITKFIEREDGQGYDRVQWRQNFGWNGIDYDS